MAASRASSPLEIQFLSRLAATTLVLAEAGKNIKSAVGAAKGRRGFDWHTVL